LAVFLSGAFLRFHALGRQSLWDDEMTSVHVVSVPFRAELSYHRVYEFHPPLFFCQLRLWKRYLGSSLVVLRANSAAWGALSLLALYGLAVALGYSSAGALWAMAFLAFSPFHLAYSQELRPYALAVFLGTAGFWLLEILLREDSAGRRGRVWTWGLNFLVIVAELYTHLWGAFVVCAQSVEGLWRFKGRTRWVWTGICAGAVLLFCFWLPIVWRQIHNVGGLSGFWMLAPSPLNLVRTFLAFSGVYFRFASSDFLYPGPPGVRGLIIGLYAVGFVLGFRRAPRAVLLWLLLGLGLPFALSYRVPALYLWYRYTVLIYPAFLLWVVAGWDSVRPAGLRRLCLGLVLAAEIWGCRYYCTGWEKANPQAVVAYVNSQTTRNTVIIRPAYFSDLFSFYYTGSAPVFDQDREDSVLKRRRFRGADILLVAFDVPSDPITDAFRSEFKNVAARHFPGFAHLGITVYSFR
jgi:uncharacterized membrane protein